MSLDEIGRLDGSDETRHYLIIQRSSEPADIDEVAGRGAAKSDTCLIRKCFCVASCW